MLRKNATTRRKSFLQGLKPVGIAQFTSALKHRPPEEKCYTTKKSFLQGLKPIESTQFTSALKRRPPEEKDFFRSL